MQADRYSGLLFQTCLFGCLLGIAATIYFLLGLAGALHSQPLNLSIAIILALAFGFFTFHFFAALRLTNWLGRAIWCAIAAIIIVEIILSLVPPTARDELTHHLAIPRLYARAGRIIEVPMAPYAYYPMLVDMLFTPWVIWGYDFVPKLIHGLFGLLTGLSLYAYLSRRMNSIYGLLGFFFFISVPAVLRISHWAYVDLAVTFYCTASLLCILRWREEKQSKSWLLLAALAAGFTVASKPNGFVAWGLLSVIFTLCVVNEPERGAGKMLSELVLFAVVGALPFLPWLIKNWLQTGNPFFPLMAGFFPSKAAAGAAASTSFVGIGILAKREFLYGETWWQIAALPIRLFFSGQDDSPRYFDGVLSPILLLLLPWAFKGKWREEKMLLMGFAVLFLAYAIVLVDIRVRYILPMVPPLVVLLVYGVFNVYLNIKQPAYLFVGLLFFAALNGSYLWSYFNEVAPLSYITGRETRDEYLARSLAEYPALHFINRQLPASAKIYLLFAGRRAYYCDRDYFHDGGELPGLLINALRLAKEPADIDRALREKGLTHLLVREELLVRFLQDNLTPTQRSVWQNFVSNHLRGLFRQNGFAVFQLHGKSL
jgi:hypothetical protein